MPFHRPIPEFTFPQDSPMELEDRHPLAPPPLVFLWKLNFLSFHLSVMMAKEKPPITVVGDVGGRIAIIVVRTPTFMSLQTIP